MQYQNNIIGKLLTPVNRRKFKRIVEKYKGDYAAKKLTCWEQFIAILLGQFGNCTSLREIEAAVKFHSNEHYHLGLRGNIAKSTLANANEKRDWRIYRDLFYDLIFNLKKTEQYQAREIIKIIDSTPINLKLTQHPWIETTLKVKGLKTHVVYDLTNETPIYFDITGARTNDITWAKNNLEIEKGVTYIADRGYTDYNFWYEINESGAFFVTRLKKDARIENITEIQSNETGISSQIFKLTNRNPRGGTINKYAQIPLKKVIVERDGNSPLVLVTNDFNRSDKEIADLYKSRWQIELFFKWIKGNLKIKKFLGRSENAIRTQICIAMIAFVLLKLLTILQKFCKNISLKTMITIVKNGLFTKLSLKPPNNKQSNAFNQLHFNLSFSI